MASVSNGTLILLSVSNHASALHCFSGHTICLQLNSVRDATASDLKVTSPIHTYDCRRYSSCLTS